MTGTALGVVAFLLVVGAMLGVIALIQGAGWVAGIFAGAAALAGAFFSTLVYISPQRVAEHVVLVQAPGTAAPRGVRERASTRGCQRGGSRERAGISTSKCSSGEAFQRTASAVS